MKEIREIRADHVDDDNYKHIDVWYSDDDNAEGKTVALVCLDTQKVIYMDNIHRLNPKIRDVIKIVLQENVQPTWVCKKCGGSNVQTKGWVKPNENNVFVDLVSEEINDNWCEDCQENVILVKA